MEAEERGFAAPVWMTFRQAKCLGGCVKKGEKGSLSVYANTFKKTETDEKTSEEIEQNIPYTVEMRVSPGKKSISLR